MVEVSKVSMTVSMTDGLALIGAWVVLGGLWLGLTLLLRMGGRG